MARMTKYITVQEIKDTNGVTKYLYNFMDELGGVEQKEINREFRLFGRLSNRGIVSQLNPKEFKRLITEPLLWNKLGVGAELEKAQRAIDKCNAKRGCREMCHRAQIDACDKLRLHAGLMCKLEYIQEFLKAPLIEQ